MQWTIEEVHNWEELREFVDTALLPLYLYKQESSLPVHVQKMSYLLNIAAAIERRLRGRVILFPLSYQVGEQQSSMELPEQFSYYFVLQFSGQKLRYLTPAGAGQVHYLTIGDEDLDSELRFEVTVDIIYQEILRLWKHQ